MIARIKAWLERRRKKKLLEKEIAFLEYCSERKDRGDKLDKA